MKPAVERIADALEGILSHLQGNKPDDDMSAMDCMIAGRAIADAWEKSLKPTPIERHEELNGRVE